MNISMETFKRCNVMSSYFKLIGERDADGLSSAGAGLDTRSSSSST